MIDLSPALDYIALMKERGSPYNYKIGIINEEFGGDVATYKNGEVVIYREESDNREDNARGEISSLTVECPPSQKKIDDCRKNGSPCLTHRTMVCVPLKYVEEVKLQ